MITPHRTLQMALDALDNLGSMSDHDVTPYAWHVAKAEAACAALREALNAPEPEPVALESVHLTRDTRGMCVVRVNGKIAIRDNGDIIDHMATLEWFAAPPAAPIPDGMVMVPREPTEEMIQAAAGAWGESESGLHNAFAAALRGGIAAAPAAPVPDGWVPLMAVLQEVRYALAPVSEYGLPGTRDVDQARLKHVVAMIDRAIAAAPAPAAPVVREPDPDTHKCSLCGVIGWHKCGGILQAHGITGGKP